MTAVHLGFLPWALGGVHVWSQFVSLGLAAVGFVLALGVRGDPPSGSALAQPAAKLWRWPFFWAGLVTLAYIAVQGFNPSWRFVADGRSWWLVPIPHLAWLPTGVAAPFARSNPWRGFLVLGSLWLLVCSVRRGFLRRQSFRVLFALLTANAGLLALLGMAEQITGTPRIFWSYTPSNPQFVASFIYRNHAGAYFDLMVALAAALAWWHYRRSRRLLESPAQTVFFAFLAAFVALIVIFSASRMAIFLILVFGIVVAGTSIAQFLRRDGEGEGGREAVSVLAALAACLLIGLIAIGADTVWGRFAELANDPAATLRDRMWVRQAAGQMLRDRWFFGWGAGCFRYGFPLYAQHYPTVYEYGNGLRKYWEHAHDDLLEIPIELGAAGLLPIAATLASGLPGLRRRRFWRNPVSFCIILACALTVAHGWLDFVFQCPAVLLTWSVLLVAAARWAELDPSAARHRLNRQRGNTPEPSASSPA